MTNNITIKTKYHGRPFMVGHVMNDTFYHRSTSTQWNEKLHSLGGYDLVVLDYLHKHGVDTIYHWVTDGNHSGVYKSSVVEHICNGKRVTHDGRDRMFVDVRDGWLKVNGYPVEVMTKMRSYVRREIVL